MIKFLPPWIRPAASRGIKSFSSEFRMSLIRLATLAIAASLFCFFASPVRGQFTTEEWTEHPQPGGGVLPLPAGFTIVELVSDAVGKPSAGGITIYSQSLINAKGLNNKVINSIKASRRWNQDAAGRVLDEPPVKPEKMIRSFLNLMQQQWVVFEVIDGPKPFTAGEITGWRASVRFNNGASRMDMFAFLKGGILYYLTAAYRISAADYWAPKTDEIMAKWKPAEIVGELTAPAKPPPSTEWKSVELATGERFMLPPTWVVVAQNYLPEKVTEEGITIAMRRLLNIRPNREKGDVSTVNVVSVAAEDAITRQAVPVTDADLLDLHDSMASGMNPAKSRSAVRREVAGSPAYVTSLVVESGMGIPYEGFLLSTIRGDLAYLFTAAFPPGQAAEFEAKIADILRRSTFIPSVSKPVSFTLSSPEQATPLGTSDSLFDPTVLLVSFLLTWGIGLTPPLLIRYAILRRPLRGKFHATAIAGGFLILNIVIFTALGSTSKTHGALVLVCFASYYILRQGAARFAASERG